MIIYSQFITWGSLRLLADSDGLSIVAYVTLPMRPCFYQQRAELDCSMATYYSSGILTKTWKLTPFLFSESRCSVEFYMLEIQTHRPKRQSIQ